MYYHTGISGNTGDVVAVLEGNRTVFSFIIPRSQYVGRVMYSSPDETFENDCEIYKWGEVQGVTKHHRILIEDGNFVGGYFVDVPIQITTSEE